MLGADRSCEDQRGGWRARSLNATNPEAMPDFPRPFMDDF